MDDKRKSFLRKLVPSAAFLAGLCCFSPLVLVLLGLSSVSFASSLADSLYGTYKWLFRAAGLLFLAAALVWYFYRKEGICTLDAVKRNRTRIINTTLLAFFLVIVLYLLWLYVIVHYAGVWLGIWE
ncbi:MAG TPA: hypothetical protein VJK52_00565 [Candidatus Nanoarchaeia archaeon]|nr:hypothetical protein [Candidatus Nanoarchaeia archaeon]